MHIDYIEFASRDRAATESFLEKAFGWTFTSYGPGYSAFDDAGIDGGVEQAKADAVPVPPLVILYSADLAAAEAAVRDAGGEITVPVYDFPGGRRFHFREPGGNELAVWSDPQPAS